MAEESKAEQSVEMISFGIIANAGDARSFAFQVLEAAKHGNFDEADEWKPNTRQCVTGTFTGSLDDKYVSTGID